VIANLLGFPAHLQSTKNTRSLKEK